MTYNIIIPKRDGSIGQETINTENNIVFVGANGAGKTRLSVRIELFTQNHITVHRISAQKALNIPDYAHIKNLQEAEKDLLFGRSDQYAGLERKAGSRWGDKPATFLLNDYDKLLSLLFAKSTERDRIYTLDAKESQAYKEVPKSPIDMIIELWNSIMPHREISFLDGKVVAKKTGQVEYHGQEMSDG